jgi:broad specificity phosphatase PhoE
MQLILVRHGLTLENEQKICQGWLPGHLSSKGKRQALLLAKKLKDKKLAAIYTSDLARAMDTAHAIAKYHPAVPFIITKKLRERNFGKLAGKKDVDINWQREEQTGELSGKGNGETRTQLSLRAQKFLRVVYKKHSKKTVVFVTHASLIIAINALLKFIPPENMYEHPWLKQGKAVEVPINKACLEYPRSHHPRHNI